MVGRTLLVIARSEATKQSIYPRVERWIASRNLSSGAHSRDPLARNDGKNRAEDEPAGPNHPFWLQGRAPGGQADAGERRISQRGVPLRPDERSDVGGPAPGLERHHDQCAQPAERRRAVRIARRRRRHRRYRLPRGRGGRRRLPRHRLRHQHRYARGRPQPRAGAPSRPAGFLRRGQCRGAGFPRPQLRRLHHRVRHPQRAADRCRAA